MNCKLTVSLCLGLLTPQIFAGVGSSGGGAGVVCVDENENIISVEFYDLYEAKHLHHLTLRESSGDPAQDYDLAEQNVRRLQAGPPLDEDVAAIFRKFVSLAHFQHEALELLPDLGKSMALPSGCHYEQIARSTGMNDFTIHTNLWNALSPLHKSALVLHELMYRDAREWGGATTSESTRKKIALFYADNHSAVTDGLPAGSPGYSASIHPHDGSTEFYVTPWIEGRVQKGVELHFTVLFGILFEKVTMKIPCRWNLSPHTMLVAEAGAHSVYQYKIPGIQLAGFELRIHYIYGRQVELELIENGRVIKREPVRHTISDFY